MARWVMVGAGAVGGVMGALLHERGEEVVMYARGAHYEAIASRGLTVESPDGKRVLDIPVVDDLATIDWRGDETAVLAVKTQDCAAALSALSAVAPPSITVLCAQNGVENERLALRKFERVYGAEISCYTSYFTPGTVVSHGSPVAGIMLTGRYPRGCDDTAEEIAAAYTRAGWIAQPTDKIIDWKYAKLLRNLANAVSAICGPDVRYGPIMNEARAEAERAYRAAGISYVDDEEWREKAGREGVTLFRPVGAMTIASGSSWQSLVRDAGSIETDYLNGEIVLLGRLHGVPTPVNALLCRLANDFARNHTAPGSMTEDQFLALLDAQR